MQAQLTLGSTGRPMGVKRGNPQVHPSPDGQVELLSARGLDDGPLVGPGILQVTGGDLVTATYDDADDGTGGTNIVRQATAAVDCNAPAISLNRVYLPLPLRPISPIRSPGPTVRVAPSMIGRPPAR